MEVTGEENFVEKKSHELRVKGYLGHDQARG